MDWVRGCGGGRVRGAVEVGVAEVRVVADGGELACEEENVLRDEVPDEAQG